MSVCVCVGKTEDAPLLVRDRGKLGLILMGSEKPLGNGFTPGFLVETLPELKKIVVNLLLNSSRAGRRLSAFSTQATQSSI